MSLRFTGPQKPNVKSTIDDRFSTFVVISQMHCHRNVDCGFASVCKVAPILLFHRRTILQDCVVELRILNSNDFARDSENEAGATAAAGLACSRGDCGMAFVTRGESARKSALPVDNQCTGRDAMMRGNRFLELEMLCKGNFSEMRASLRKVRKTTFCAGGVLVRRITCSCNCFPSANFGEV